ncbi:hypothetical protein LCL95_06295 [Bacillus timonensis]|nr:hypothetical protein [Bacillus timonensis]
MSKEGRINPDQNTQQIREQESKVGVELGSEFQVGNSKNQSQKKSGRQINKK